jgi:hypothetical protein
VPTGRVEYLREAGRSAAAMSAAKRRFEETIRASDYLGLVVDFGKQRNEERRLDFVRCVYPKAKVYIKVFVHLPRERLCNK